jgi:hypothetical protein
VSAPANDGREVNHGAAVGSSVRTHDGVAVRATVGASVGFTVGFTVGSNVGARSSKRLAARWSTLRSCSTW